MSCAMNLSHENHTYTGVSMTHIQDILVCLLLIETLPAHVFEAFKGLIAMAHTETHLLTVVSYIPAGDGRLNAKLSHRI